MKYLFIAGIIMITGVAQAAQEEAFLEQIQPSMERNIGHGHSALWTLSDVATQYQPLHSTPVLQAAAAGQQEGRFLDALILLENELKNGQAGADDKDEMNLLRASFLLQGDQPQQALEILSLLTGNTRHAADAYALTAMALLQQGKMREALDAAQQAHDSGSVPHLALSYALQGTGKLAEALEVMRRFNASAPQAVTLAREAELALTLGRDSSARELVNQALKMDASNPYVISVGGLSYLIDGHSVDAKASFETALRRNPRDAKALFGLGLAEIKLGNFAAGQKKLQAAHEADPGNALILTYLGRSQQQSGQTAAARENWHDAQLADPQDPIPWLYQAQAQLQANRPLEARESLREAQARSTNRSVYRGENLLREDMQLLQANLAETQRLLGLEGMAFHTLSDTVGEKNSASLRNQADVLQGQRFGESARRSLLLQSLFNERPGNLPSALDIYGDGFGQTGASVPQHGVISSIGATQTSFNNYDALFSKDAVVKVDATIGSKNTNGEQARFGVGSDTLGLSVAQLKLKTDGFVPFHNLDNRAAQGMVQWRPMQSTQVFVAYQTINSRRGETYCPADPITNGMYHQYEDKSDITRLGMRHSLSDSSELRGLISHQQTGQIDNWQWMPDLMPPNFATNILGIPYQVPGTTYGINNNSSTAGSGELQYRSSGAGYATQWGVSSVHSTVATISMVSPPVTRVAQQVYADWQQTLNPYWQLEAGLAWGRGDKRQITSTGYDVSTYERYWLPKLGLVYTSDSATHVRLAAWKGLSNIAVGDASLASPQLAGIILNRPDDNHKLVRGAALGADKQLNATWLLEGQAQRRWSEDSWNSGNGVRQKTPMHIDESRLALHWQPDALNVTLAYNDEIIQNDPKFSAPDSVLRQHLRSEQLGLCWFASSQWTTNLGWSHNLLKATQQSSDINFNPTLLDVSQRFNQMDASVNWRFNRLDSLDAGVRNATNVGVKYTETDPLIPRFSQGRLLYAKLKLAW